MPGFVIGDTQQTGPSPVVETARSHRWRVEVTAPIPGINDVTLYAYSVTRPVPEIDQVKMHHRQNEINLPGKYRYNTCSIKFYEKIDPETKKAPTAEIIHKWWAAHTTNYMLHSVNIWSFRRTVRIFLEDGQGNTVHKYKLINAWPSKVEGSELDYSSSEIATIMVTLVCDFVDEIND